MIQSLISSTAVAVAALPISHKISAVPPPLPTVSYHNVVASHSDGPQPARPVQRYHSITNTAKLHANSEIF